MTIIPFAELTTSRQKAILAISAMRRRYKATREHLGTQAEVAAMLGVNRVTVAKRESGTMTITNEAVLAIQSLLRPHDKRFRGKCGPRASAF